MIQGIGIDAVEVHRFAPWHILQKKQLARIFSTDEINHCLAHPIKSAERFAVRFAAKEAFFKAWHSAFPNQYVPFLTLCRAVSVTHTAQSIPQVLVLWHLLPAVTPLPKIHISLTHTETMAFVSIILENIQSEMNRRCS